jgi:hypothetical protein
MTKKLFAIALAVLFAMSLVGCATDGGYYDPARSAGAGALGGAATGAAVGSIVGAATGHAGTGAWVGAAAGGVVGGVGGALYASHRNSEIRSSQAAAQAYQYRGQGNVVSIDNANATPTTVRPGQQVNLGMNYTVLTPSNAPVTLTVVREVRYGGTTVGTPYQVSVSSTNGTYNDTMDFTVPENAPQGNYTVVNRVMSNYGSAQKEAHFSVQ